MQAAPLALVFSLAAAALQAQASFAPFVVKRHLPVRLDHSRAAAIADVDGDGAPDLVFANVLERHRLLMNRGHGRFVDESDARMPDAADEAVDVVSGDFDGDGDADLAIACWLDAQNRLYLNDGAGRFADATSMSLPAGIDDSRGIAAGDVDADGDLDLVVANASGEPDRLYLNDGRGRYADATAETMPEGVAAVFALAIGDVDGDGDLDCAAGDRLLLNDGSGRFALAPRDWIPFGSGAPNDAALVDLDGDGDLDLLRASGAIVFPARDLVSLNDGSGRFLAAPGAVAGGPAATLGIAVGDVDGDGDADWAAAVAGLWGGAQNRLHLNDGAGTFVLANAEAMPVDGEGSSGVAVGDLDGDGAPEIVFANWRISIANTEGRARQYRRDPERGGFVDVTDARMPDVRGSRDVALADVDRDGDLDIVLARTSADQDLLLVNDGAGRFTDATAGRMPVDRSDSEAIVLGDVDGDGAPDLLVAKRREPSRLYLNDGAGTFRDVTGTHMPSEVWAATNLALGDVDGDGDLDLVVANYGSGVPFSRQQNRLYVNDGAGGFTDRTFGRMPDDRSFSNCVALADVDGDGDLDVAFGNSGQNLLYVNDGAGVFSDVTAARLPADSVQTVALAFGDVDGDGDQDLAVGNWAARTTRIYANDGAGTFRDLGTLPEDRDYTSDVVFADVDEDGMLDLIAANGSPNHAEPNRIQVNLERRIEAPWLPVIGTSYELELLARPGRLELFRIAVPVIAPLAGRRSLPPFGVYGLDPASAIALGPAYVPPGAGRATISIAIPSDAGLVGGALHVQAVFLDPRGGARFGNVLHERIGR